MNRRFPTLPGTLTTACLGLGALALAGCLACGGSSASTGPKSTVATGLVYTAPTSQGYRLVADPASTATNLVLNLLGPTGEATQGVIFKVSCDGTKATWVAPAGSATLARPGTALNLGTGLPLLQSSASGQELQAALFQKGGTAATTLGASPILSVALSLKAGAPQGKVMLMAWPECKAQGAAGESKPISVAVGELVAK